MKQTQMGAPHKSAYGCIAAFMQRSLSVKVCPFYADYAKQCLENDRHVECANNMKVVGIRRLRLTIDF